MQYVTKEIFVKMYIRPLVEYRYMQVSWHPRSLEHCTQL